MRMKSLILIFIALGCGLVASIGISQVMDRGGSGGNMEMEQILVALADIDINAKLSDKNVKLEDWPKNKVPEGSIRRLDDVKDKFALSRFVKGEPIHVSKITDNPDNVTRGIPQGYRAMPVKVDEDTVMKAISPGDRVDVMVFLKRDLNNGIAETGAFTIIKNVRVFAVNTNTERTSSDSDGKGSAAFRTVSLLLKPEHTRELAVAARVGKIVLTLRSPEEQDTASGEEEVTPISQILKGNASIGSDPVDAGGGSVIPFRAPTPGGPVQWSIDVLTPAGVDTYQWTDIRQMPIKTGSAPVDPNSGSDDGSNNENNGSQADGGGQDGASRIR